MYPVSNAEIALFRKGCYQVLNVTVSGAPGLTKIAAADMIENSFQLDRRCFSSDNMEIGTAVAAEMSLELDNHTGKFDDVVFDGVVLTVSISIRDWETVGSTKYEIPIGVFIVDDSSKNKSTITLNALDFMVKFDREYDSDLVFPATLGEIIQDACSKCGITQYTTTFPNSAYTVPECPKLENLTYRKMIQWVAEIAGCNAYADWYGQFRMTGFQNSGFLLTGADRYDSDISEETETITGVKIETVDGESTLVGTTGYVLQITGNELIQSDPAEITQTLFTVYNGFHYVPYSCTALSFPFLYPMDMISFTDSKGNTHSTVVSSVTYTVNGSMKIAGNGTSKTKSGYTPTGLTSQERLVISKAAKENDAKSLERYTTLLHLNQMIGNGVGLHETVVIENETKVWYYHDKETLSDSTIIYTFNANGFAWTDDWNDGSPVWKYGISKEGNAVFKILSAYKIQAEYLDAGCVTADKIAAGSITADKIVADDLHIKAGNIDGTLTASQINADGIVVKEGNIAGWAITENYLGKSTTETTVNSEGNEETHTYMVVLNTDIYIRPAQSTFINVTMDGDSVYNVRPTGDAWIGGFDFSPSLGMRALKDGSGVAIRRYELVGYRNNMGISVDWYDLCAAVQYVKNQNWI